MAVAPMQKELLLADSEILAAIFKTLTVGAAVCDGRGKFILFNPEAERILGLGSMDAPPAGWTGVCGCFRPDMATPYPPGELCAAARRRLDRRERPAGSGWRERRGGRRRRLHRITEPQNMLRRRYAADDDTYHQLCRAVEQTGVLPPRSWARKGALVVSAPFRRVEKI